MGQEVKIVKGNLEGNVLDNAASEHTLNELLEAIKRMEKQTGPNSKKAAKEQERHTREVGRNTKATEDLTKAKTTYRDVIQLAGRGFRLLTQGIGSLTSGLFSVTESMVDFSVEIIEAQPEVTDFTRAIANSRLNILGLGTVVHRLTELLMTNYRSFQTLSESGILLGNRISELQSDFAGMGVNASTLTTALTQNAHLFALYGSASTAATRALDGMRRITSDTREELLRFGISFEEQTEIFVGMYARNTRALRQGLVTTEEINEQSVRYARSLRTIAELTGVSARELQDQQDRLNQEQALQARLDQLRAEGREDEANQIEEYIRYMEASLNEGGRDLAIATVMGTTATTEAAISLQGYMNNVSDFARDMYRASLDTPDADDFRSLFTTAANQLAHAQTLSDDLTLAQALIFAGEGDVVNTLLRFTRLFGGSLDDAETMLGDLDDSGEAITSFTELLRVFRNAVADVSRAFFANETVQSGLVSFREWLEYFKEQATGEWLDNFIQSIEEFDPSQYNPFDEEGRANIAASFNTLVERMGNIFQSFWEGPNSTALRDTISGFFEFLIEELILSINRTTGLFGGSARRIQEERVSNQSPEDHLEAVVAETNEDLNRNQQAYREMAEEAAELAYAINRLGTAMTDQDPYAHQMVSPMQNELDRLLQIVDSDHVDARARQMEIEDLLETFERQAERSNARWTQWGRDRSSDAAEEAINQLRNLDYDFDNLPLDLRDHIDRLGIDLESRRIGTLQATGMRSEPRDTVTQIHAGERVLNPQETEEYNNRDNTQSQRDMISKLDELNTSMHTMISLMTQEVAIQSRTMNTISGLGPDLMKGVPG